MTLYLSFRLNKKEIERATGSKYVYRMCHISFSEEAPIAQRIKERKVSFAIENWFFFSHEYSTSSLRSLRYRELRRSPVE